MHLKAYSKYAANSKYTDLLDIKKKWASIILAHLIMYKTYMLHLFLVICNSFF